MPDEEEVGDFCNVPRDGLRGGAGPVFQHCHAVRDKIVEVEIPAPRRQPVAAAVHSEHPHVVFPKPVDEAVVPEQRGHDTTVDEQRRGWRTGDNVVLAAQLRRRGTIIMMIQGLETLRPDVGLVAFVGVSSEGDDVFHPASVGRGIAETALHIFRHVQIRLHEGEHGCWVLGFGN